MAKMIYTGHTGVNTPRLLNDTIRSTRKSIAE